jgi:hypothetical protein
MVYFQTKNPNEGKYGRVLQSKMLAYFYGHLVYFTAIWYTLWSFGIYFPVLVHYKANFVVIWYIFSVLVCCSTKNLATLQWTMHLKEGEKVDREADAFIIASNLCFDKTAF